MASAPAKSTGGSGKRRHISPLAPPADRGSAAPRRTAVSYRRRKRTVLQPTQSPLQRPQRPTTRATRCPEPSSMPAAAPRLKIGLSACFQHADPTRPLFTNKTLQYVEQSIAHWIMSSGAIVVMVPCPTGETARGDVTLQHYAEWLDGVVMHGGADVWPGNYGEEPLRDEWVGDRVRDIYDLALVKAFAEV
eukprot:gene32436-43335_t